MNITRSNRPIPVWFAVVIYTVMTVVVLYPILVVQVPGLGDYLNHLARMHILYYHPADLSRFYRIEWQPIPYLSMDAAFAVLSHLAPIYDAGRIFLGICVVLPVLSVAVLHYAVHRRLSLLPAAAFLFCQNYLLSWGFLNYLSSACLAILLFAAWFSTARWPRWIRAALFCVLATALYLCHLVAFGSYCLAVGGYELARAWRTGFRPWRAITADWLAAGLQAVPALLLALSVHVEPMFVGPQQVWYGDVPAKLLALESPVLFYDGRADFLAGVFAMLVLVTGLVTHHLRLAPAIWPAILAVGMAALCLPNVLLGIFGLDFRLPLVVAMLLTGAISTTPRMGRGLACAVLGGFLALTVVRSIGIANTLTAVDKQIAEFRQVVSVLPRGVRLLVVDTATGGQNQRDGPWRTTSQASMVASIDRDAFIPFLFSGVTIVHPAVPMRTSSAPGGHPPPLSDLAVGAGRTDRPGYDVADGEGVRIYWFDWEDKFDYVLIQHFGRRPAAVPANLVLVNTSSVADLYRIDKTDRP